MERTVSLNGFDMHFVDRGAGEPLMLVHGFTGSSADWGHVFDLEELARGRRLIVPDLRGHGRSTNPSGAFTFRQCALDVLALLDRIGVDRFCAIGMSLGAKTLLHVATQAPGRVDAMILVSGAPYFPEEARAIMRASASAERSPEEWASMRSRHAHGDDQIRALWEMPARFAERYDDMNFTKPFLSTIAARTLVVHGDRDPFYPVELAVEMYRAIPRSSLWIVPGGGHGPIFGDSRAPFAAAALAFLGR